VTYVVDGRGAVLKSFGLFSGIFARAMPALARALMSLTFMKVSGASTVALEPHLRQLDEVIAKERRDEATPQWSGASDVVPSLEDTAQIVALDSISFQYPTAAAHALRSVSLDLRRGELLAIRGESGAGKTTLVDVLIGLLSPQDGTVRRPAIASIGYVAQETFAWDESVRFNVTLGRAPTTGDVDKEVWERLESAQLADWVRGLPEGLDARMGERGGRMSGGQRQRLGLARALYGHPSILVLDEPTSALDVDASRSLMVTLTSIKSNIGIIAVTHDPIVMEYGDRTITLETVARDAVG